MKLFTCFILLGFVMLHSSAQVNWTAQEIRSGENLQKMEFLNATDAVVVGYGKTIKKTTNQGASWNDIGVATAAYDFIDISIEGGIGYLVSRRTKVIDNPSTGESDVSVNGVILKTVDNGTTWTLIDLAGIGSGENPATNPNAAGAYNLDPYAVEAVDANTAYVYLDWYDLSTGVRTTHSAVFKTTDGGFTWLPVTSDLGSTFITSIEHSGTDVYIAGNKTLLKASTLDETLTDLYPTLDATISSAEDNAFINDIFISGDEIYFPTGLDGVWMTSNDGTSFSRVGTMSGANDFWKVDANVMIALGSSTKSYATNDGGSNWTNCYPGITQWEIGGVLNGYLYGLAKSNIYKIPVSDLQAGTYNTWVSQEISLNNNIQKMHIIDDNNAILIGYGKTCKRTTDAGATWHDVDLSAIADLGGDFDFIDLCSVTGFSAATTPKLKLIDYPTSAGKEDVYLSGIITTSTDNWETFSYLDNKKIGAAAGNVPDANPFADNCGALNIYSIGAFDASNLYINAVWYEYLIDSKVTHSRVFKTTDGGNTWTAITEDLGSAIVTSICCIGNSVYLGGNNILSKVTGGTTLTSLIPNLPNDFDGSTYVQDITIVSETEFYIVTTSDGIFYTNNSGDSFTKVAGLTGANDFYAIDVNSFVNVGTTSKTLLSNDAGTNWVSCSAGTTLWEAPGVWNDYFYTLGKSNIYKVSLAELDNATAIDKATLLENIKILNRPDILEIRADEQLMESCIIYNIAGQMVKIADQPSYFFEFNKSEFKSGLYIISISQNKVKSNTKIMID